MDKSAIRLFPRYSLAVDIELTDLQSEKQVRERTKDLSLFGCSIANSAVFPKGTRGRVRLAHEGQQITALAQVIYCRPDLGMGVAFYVIEAADERVLEEWLAELSHLPVRRSENPSPPAPTTR